MTCFPRSWCKWCRW